MPTEISSPSAPIIEHKAPDVSLLGIVAILIFVLHLAGGIAFDRSRANPAVAPAAFAALDGEAKCTAQAARPEPSLPYD